MDSDSKKLLELYRRLAPSEQATLFAFAEFLESRSEAANAPVEPPREIPRPAQESVVAAIKRLSATYHMVDRSKMLHETSALMGQHLMQGRAAAEVIDELEVLFLRHYERLSQRDA